MQERDNKSRLSSENDPVVEAVKNSALQCADCAFMLPGNTIECEKYFQKPGYVLWNETLPQVYAKSRILKRISCTI